MATITSAGIGSGLDVNSIISQLMALERRPLTALQTSKSGLQTQLSDYGRVASSLDTLRSAARALTQPTTWSAAKASVGDASALTALASAGAAPGSYAVQVSRLAATQMTATAAVADSSTVIGQGTVRIELGAWSAGAPVFTPKAGAAAVDIVIGPGEDSLSAIRDKINAASAGVRASIVTDTTGARLVLNSATSGETNGFRVTVTDNDGVPNDLAGLSRLAYDPENAAGVATRTQAAADAVAVINGLTVQSATNSLGNVVDGLSLTLTKTTTAPVEVTVVRDEAAMRESVKAFADGYNSAVKLMKDLTKFNGSGAPAGSLQGDRALVGLIGQLRGLLAQGSSASATFDRAAQVGLDVQTDGSIKIVDAKLDAALANPTEISKFFSTAGADTASSGLGMRLRDAIDQVLGAEGTVPARQEGIRNRIARNDDQQEAYGLRLERIEARFRAQYTALDRAMGNLNGLQSLVTQQLANWNRSSGA